MRSHAHANPIVWFRLRRLPALRIIRIDRRDLAWINVTTNPTISMLEHIALRVVGCLIAEFKIQISQVNLAALFSEYSRVKAPRLFWANLYEIPNRIRA
jgi:hypothetical protein